MGEPTCSIDDDDCQGFVYARGYCRIHYGRWRTHGDPLRVDKTGVPAGPVKLCSVDGCEGKVNSHGLCNMHDQRRRRHGDPELGGSTVIADLEERFLSHVRKEPGGCWVWTAGLFPDGYGNFHKPGTGSYGAHRWSYEHFTGAVPDGLQVEHMCHTREKDSCPGGVRCLHRRCVNPAHLEVLTKAENNKRGIHRCKVSPEYALELHARWIAGEPVTALAAEAGVLVGAIYKRFQRIARDAAAA
jgi:hypothetical protein